MTEKDAVKRALDDTRSASNTGGASARSCKRCLPEGGVDYGRGRLNEEIGISRKSKSKSIESRQTDCVDCDRKYGTRVRVTGEKPESERGPDRAGNGTRSERRGEREGERKKAGEKGEEKECAGRATLARQSEV